ALDLGFTGVMAYSLAEAIWLAEDGVEDVLVAYPSVDTAALVRLARSPLARERVTLMVDDVSQVALIERAFIRADWPEGPRLQVRGVMFYEAQVAGMPEAGLKGPVIRLVKALSLQELAGRRPAVVTALEERLGRQLLVNGGGSGSVQQTATDPTITEITAGS